MTDDEVFVPMAPPATAKFFKHTILSRLASLKGPGMAGVWYRIARWESRSKAGDFLRSLRHTRRRPEAGLDGYEMITRSSRSGFSELYARYTAPAGTSDPVLAERERCAIRVLKLARHAGPDEPADAARFAYNQGLIDAAEAIRKGGSQ